LQANNLITWPRNSTLQLACLHDQNKNGFFGGPLLFSQSEQFEKFSKIPDWLEKSRLSKKATFALIM